MISTVIKKVNIDMKKHPAGPGRPRDGWPTYEEARDLIRKRQIKSRREYTLWHEKNRIRFLPSRPHRVYVNEWTGWNDFLGNNNTFNANKRTTPYRPYWDAVKYIHTLGLKTIAEWREFKWSGELPDDIPKTPEVIYSDYWTGFQDWLGVTAGSKVKVAEGTVEEALWVLLYEVGDPENVVWWKKVSSAYVLGQWIDSGAFRLIRKFKFEPELQSRVKEILDQHSSEYHYEPSHRLVQNLNMMIWDLSNELLIV